MKRSEGQWPTEDEFNKAMEQAPEGWNTMTPESLDEMSEHYLNEEKKKK